MLLHESEVNSLTAAVWDEGLFTDGEEMFDVHVTDRGNVKFERLTPGPDVVVGKATNPEAAEKALLRTLRSE